MQHLQADSGAVGVRLTLSRSVQRAAEAVAALVSLGYSQSEASLAVGRLDGTLSTDELIKQALKSLARRI